MSNDLPLLYQCPICQLHFTEESLKEQCEAWCRTQESCHLQIARQSVEAKAAREQKVSK